MHKLQEYEPDTKDPIKRIGRIKRIKNTGIATESPPDGGQGDGIYLELTAGCSFATLRIAISGSYELGRMTVLLSQEDNFTNGDC